MGFDFFFHFFCVVHTMYLDNDFNRIVDIHASIFYEYEYQIHKMNIHVTILTWFMNDEIEVNWSSIISSHVSRWRGRRMHSKTGAAKKTFTEHRIGIWPSRSIESSIDRHISKKIHLGHLFLFQYVYSRWNFFFWAHANSVNATTRSFSMHYEGGTVLALHCFSPLAEKENVYVALAFSE